MKAYKSNSDETRQITDEDYENDLRHKHVSKGLYNTSKGGGRNQPSLQLIDLYDTSRMQILNRLPIIMNGKRFAIVAHIVQLIVIFLGKTPCSERSETDYI